MPKQQIENLISNLHDHFGDDATSPQQQQLIEKMERHIHNVQDPELIEPSFKETVELLIEEVEEEHPKAAAIAREILEVLGNIGV